jgi:hypothetical protein
VTLTVSPPVRIAAICGLLLTVVLFGGLRMLGGGGGTSSSGDAAVATPKLLKHHPFGGTAKATHKPAAVTPTVTHKTHKASKTATATKPAKAKPAAVVHRPVIDTEAIKAARAAGLPEPVARALGRYSTVVVSLYDPYSQVDGISFAEAKAGAALAGVGFVPLSVLSQPQVGKLTEQLGLLPDPGVLVYVRPGTLAAKISGFADKETVAQAAQNAAQRS